MVIHETYIGLKPKRKHHKLYAILFVIVRPNCFALENIIRFFYTKYSLVRKENVEDVGLSFRMIK